MNPLAKVLGDVRPSALGVAISPLPVIASELMLLSARLSRVALGVTFVLLALHSWPTRPRPGTASMSPIRMSTLEKISPLAALGLGAALSGLIVTVLLTILGVSNVGKGLGGLLG